MTLTESDLSKLLAAVQAGDITDTICTSLAWVLQHLIEAERTSTISAAPHERTDTCTAQRKGHRPKLISASIPSVAALVGCNRKVKQVKRVACGFRNHDDNVLRIAIHAGQKHYRPERRPERPTPRSTR